MSLGLGKSAEQRVGALFLCTFSSCSSWGLGVRIWEVLSGSRDRGAVFGSTTQGIDSRVFFWFFPPSCRHWEQLLAGAGTDEGVTAPTHGGAGGDGHCGNDQYPQHRGQGSSGNHACKDMGWIQAVLESSPPGDVGEGAAPPKPMEHQPQLCPHCPNPPMAPMSTAPV